MIDLARLTPSEVLALHARVTKELRARGITRTANNPTGDLAELLFCKAFGWRQSDNSNPNLDAVGDDGRRYQIKGRRMMSPTGSRQLSALRDLDGGHFDVLAGALFNEDYTVMRAALIPHAAVKRHATFVTRTNSHRFLLRDSIWDLLEVADATEALRAVAL